MQRTPLRLAYAVATISTLLALLLTEPALGHIDVRPRLVVQGMETVLRIELPRLRPGPPPVRLEVEGDRVAVLASSLREVAGVETRWSVRLRVDRSAPPGEVLLVLRALFADGKSVEADAGITVVPAAEPAASRGFPWLGVVAGIAAALALAGAALLFARRRSAW